MLKSLNGRYWWIRFKEPSVRDGDHLHVLKQKLLHCHLLQSFSLHCHLLKAVQEALCHLHLVPERIVGHRPFVHQTRAATRPIFVFRNAGQTAMMTLAVTLTLNENCRSWVSESEEPNMLHLIVYISRCRDSSFRSVQPLCATSTV